MRVLVVMSLAALMILIGFDFYHQARRQRDWPAVGCKVLMSTVDRVGGSNPDRPYHFRATYQFTANGRSHVGQAYSGHDYGTNDAAEMYALARKYPVGATAVCYFNPIEPAESVLVKDDAQGALIFLTSAMVGAVCLFCFYCIPQLRAMRKAPRRRSVTAPPSNLRIARWAGLTILVLGGLCAASLFGLPIAHNFQVRRWHRVPCIIESSNVIREELSNELPVPTWRTDILYRYPFAGVEYHSNQFSFTETGTLYAPARLAAVARFPAGSTAVCFVNPADPSQAVLTRHFSPGVIYVLWPLVMMLLGAFALVTPDPDQDFKNLMRRCRCGFPLILTSAALLLIVVAMVAANFLPP